MEKCLWTVEDFIFDGQRFCLSMWFLIEADENIKILEFTLNKRDMETGEIIF